MKLLNFLRIFETFIISILMAAVIAIAQKVIILDFKLLPSYTLLGIGMIIVAHFRFLLPD